MEIISSTQNPTIKTVVKLKQSRKRKQLGKFLVEGDREISLAIQSGLELERLLVRHDKAGAIDDAWLKSDPSKRSLTLVKASLFETLITRESTGHALALFKLPERKQVDVDLGEKVLILEGVEKPGNLGAIMRTADGLGIDSLLLVDCNADPFAPQTIRNSLGAVFSTPWYEVGFESALALCKEQGITICGADPAASVAIWDADLKGKTAIVMGSEADGLDARWRAAGMSLFKIPMTGSVNSFNVSVATAMCAYELVRSHRSTSK